MIKYILILIFALPIALAAQMTYVPDDNFEQALIDLGLDSGPLNDSVPTKNIDTVTSLNVSNKIYLDLTGIEEFIALKELSCYMNNLRSLDVSRNTALTYLDCSYNSLKILDISKNTALTELRCYNNSLKSLDVSNNSSLAKLYCPSNTLTSLDVSNNAALIILFCYYNHDLFCIQVADSTEAANNYNWVKDSTAHYSENCNYTGVENELKVQEAVSVSPNPASDFVEVDFGNVILSEAKDPVVVHDQLGIKYMDSRLRGNDIFVSSEGNVRIDISGLAAGVYFIQVRDKVQKFIKY